jgi:magnesium chelatase family protein
VKFAKIHSAQAKILSADPVDIEADISNGLHSFSIIGLPDKSIEEAKDRVSSAIKNSGFISPKQKNQKVVISLAPADLQKTGTNFDLPIAISYLLAAKDLEFDASKVFFIGELALDGLLRPAKGVLPIAIFALDNKFEKIIIPEQNIDELELLHGLYEDAKDRLATATNLEGVIKIIKNGKH